MLGAEDALGTGQVSVFMCDTRDDPERERRYVEMLWARRVDGLIVTGRRIEPRPPLQALPGIPVVYAMTQVTGGGAPAVLPDDERGGQLAAGHLLAIGRRRIAHIAGPERFLAARLRAGGLPAVLAEAGVEPCGEIRYGEWTEHWGREAAGLLLADRPDAIFCGSDQIARGVADTLRAVGRRVPDDVALVGFDNWAPMALGALPPLTSVDMCLEEVGRVAAQRLLAAIAGEDAGQDEFGPSMVSTVPPRLVVQGIHRRLLAPRPPSGRSGLRVHRSAGRCPGRRSQIAAKLGVDARPFASKLFSRLLGKGFPSPIGQRNEALEQKDSYRRGGRRAARRRRCLLLLRISGRPDPQRRQPSASTPPAPSSSGPARCPRRWPRSWSASSTPPTRTSRSS